jgi:hypothetical protein
LLTTLVLAGAMLASPQADKWDIKAGLAPKTTASYDLAINVSAGGQDHSAAGKLVITIKDTPQGKPPSAVYDMKDVTTDGGNAVPDQSWNLTLDNAGGIVNSDSEAGLDPVRTFLMPWTFIYPDKAVGVGDTWTDTIKVGEGKTDQSYVVNMKADSMDKVGDADALKVTEDLTQAGDNGMKSTGTWWLDKSGKILKFEVKTSNWVVYLMGDQPMDATFTGIASKP